MRLVENRVIYGRNYGEWPWAYLCQHCDAYVGLHPFTGIPLGTLATKEMRKARNEAKDAFNALWQSGHMTRTQAYAWLAATMHLPPSQTHFGMFDVDQCCAARQAIREFIAQAIREPTVACAADDDPPW